MCTQVVKHRIFLLLEFVEAVGYGSGAVETACPREGEYLESLEVEQVKGEER